MIFEYRIKPNVAEVFSSLIPDTYIDALMERRLYGVASFCDSPDREHLIGVILVRVRYQWQEIVWLALSENYALYEYAMDLIRGRTEAAGNAGVLAGTFAEFPETELLRMDYFTNAAFLTEQIDSHVFEIYTGTLASIPNTLPDEEKAHCFPLSAITSAQKANMEEQTQKSRVPWPLEQPVNWEQYDPDASVCYERDGVVICALMIVKLPDYYAIEGVFGTDPAAYGSLFSYLNTRAVDVLSDRDILLIPSLTETVEMALSGSAIARRGRRILAYRGYELSRNGVKPKPKTPGQDEKEDEVNLGLSGMPVYSDVSRFDIVPDGYGLIEFYDEAAREIEACYERHWEKVEYACIKRGIQTPLWLYQSIVAFAYKLLVAGKAQESRPSGSAFAVHPLNTVEERIKQARHLAGLVNAIRRKKTEENDEDKQPVNSIYEKAVKNVNDRTEDTLELVLRTLFSLMGIDIFSGEKINEREQLKLLAGFEKVLYNYSILSRGREWMIIEEMIRLAKKEPEYKENYSRIVKKALETNRNKAKKELHGLRSKIYYIKEKHSCDIIMKERHRLIDQVSEISSMLEALSEMEEFAGRKEQVEAFYNSKLSALGYYVDCTESFLNYLNTGKVPSIMYVVFLREKFKIDLPSLNPRITFVEQIKEFDPRFKEFAPWDMDGSNVFLAWERLKERKGESYSIKEPEGLLECRKYLEHMREEKSKYPNLFRKLILPELFTDLPELCMLINKAQVLRDGASRLLDEGFSNMTERYEIYREALAIYSTLTRRADNILYASRMTMSALMEYSTDFLTTSYEFSYGEASEVIKYR